MTAKALEILQRAETECSLQGSQPSQALRATQRGVKRKTYRESLSDDTDDVLEVSSGDRSALSVQTYPMCAAPSLVLCDEPEGATGLGS